jgi:hypothetical protein
MPKVLEDIRNILKQQTGIHYDFILLNYYRDGNDKIGLLLVAENFIFLDNFIYKLTDIKI